MIYSALSFPPSCVINELITSCVFIKIKHSFDFALNPLWAVYNIYFHRENMLIILFLRFIIDKSLCWMWCRMCMGMCARLCKYHQWIKREQVHDELVLFLTILRINENRASNDDSDAMMFIKLHLLNLYFYW